MLNETLQDIDGHLSSKRVAAFVALAVLVGQCVADLFGHHPSEFLSTDMMVVAVGGLGLACAERFAPRKDPC